MTRHNDARRENSRGDVAYDDRPRPRVRAAVCSMVLPGLVLGAVVAVGSSHQPTMSLVGNADPSAVTSSPPTGDPTPTELVAPSPSAPGPTHPSPTSSATTASTPDTSPSPTPVPSVQPIPDPAKPPPAVAPLSDGEAEEAIQARYEALGGPTGVLGAPTSPVTAVKGGGYRRSYERGRIYYSTSTGAWDVRNGPMLDHYKKRRAQVGRLGFPRSSQGAAGGRADALTQRFEGGRLYYSAATGGHAVYGKIYDRYAATRGARGPLGLPKTDDAPTRPKGTRYSVFQHGRIYYSRATGAHSVRLPIVRRYVQLGATTSWIGRPVAEFRRSPTGGSQVFENATLVYVRSVGKVYVRVPFAARVFRVTRSDVRYTYRSGCPVKPSALRLVRVPFKNFSGDHQYGKVVVRSSVTRDIIAVFRAAHRAGFPLRRVRPQDAYKGSDVASMEADNTSAFNCRKVTGNPYRLSQHSWGNAIDFNPRENPYVTASRVYPSGSRTYLNRRNVRKGMLVRGGAVEATMRRLGWLWGARWLHPDYQHFSENGR
ncbi:MAG TPA: M15 family metallopeptidase [Actinopolymorphaceae bacterium]